MGILSSFICLKPDGDCVNVEGGACNLPDQVKCLAGVFVLSVWQALVKMSPSR